VTNCHALKMQAADSKMRLFNKAIQEPEKFEKREPSRPHDKFGTGT